MARAGGVTEPGAALAGVGEQDGEGFNCPVGAGMGQTPPCHWELQESVLCAAPAGTRMVLGWHLFRIPMELQKVSLAGIADPQSLFPFFILRL